MLFVSFPLNISVATSHRFIIKHFTITSKIFIIRAMFDIGSLILPWTPCFGGFAFVIHAPTSFFKKKKTVYVWVMQDMTLCRH